jgi:hypothetical protein
MFRRRLLQAVALGTVAAVSGCLGVLQDEPRYLESLTLRNDDDSAHTFELTVSRDGEPVQETAVEMSQSSGPTRVDCEWSGRGPFTVTCSLNGERRETVELTEVEEGAGEYAHITFLATTLGELASSSHLDDGGMRRCSGPSE